MEVPLLVGGNSNALVFRYTGNGSATFDPSITTSVGVSVSWKPDDAPGTVTTGTTHNFSYTPSAGSHVCIVRVAGGLGLVTGIDCSADSISSVKNMAKISNSYANLLFTSNTGIRVSSSDICNKTGIAFYAISTSIAIPLACVKALDIRLAYLTGVTGSLTGIHSGALIVWLYSSTGITPGSIGHLIAIRDIRIYSMWPTLTAAESVDIVIDSIYAARANFTYSTGPSMQIGGTNPSPTGNYTNPTVTPGDGNSNSDWSWNGTYHVPLTPKAKIYYLVNGPDHGTDTFYRWSITYTL